MPHSSPGVLRRRFGSVIGVLRLPAKKPLASIAEPWAGMMKQTRGLVYVALSVSSITLCPFSCISSLSSLLLLSSHSPFIFPYLAFSLASPFLSLSTRRPGWDSGQLSPLPSLAGITHSQAHFSAQGLSFLETSRRYPQRMTAQAPPSSAPGAGKDSVLGAVEEVPISKLSLIHI